jgi:phospholipase C
MAALVDHVFVLMLENRSFDHFFGLSGRPGVPKPTAPGFGPGATDRAAIDPPHEFDAVHKQINGGAMDGFAPGAMLAFESAQIPVITQLASEFVLFDNWHAPVPGPTWPNRFFAHAATSGGLATSPSVFAAGQAVISPRGSFKFRPGQTLFERVAAAGKSWRVYHGDVTPQVLALPNMVKKYLTDHTLFCPIYPGDPHFSDFATDVAGDSYAPAYTFIEPNYDAYGPQFGRGDSQHPRGLVSAGESLIKVVYESIRNSPAWERSVLLITWDEHGGYYDHVAPPQAAVPTDQPSNRPASGDPGFQFDRFGVRVPAILVSPLAPRGKLGSELFPGKTFDHTSIISSVFETFAVGPALTARDAVAPTWTACLSAQARAGLPPPPTTLADTVPAAASAPAPAAASGAAVDSLATGAFLIAHALDLEIAKRSRNGTIANVTPQTAIQYQKARQASLKDPHLSLEVAQYIAEVGVRTRFHRDKLAIKAKRGS